MNSTLIKIFGHFRYENLSTVYSFQATLSNHLKISKNWWCGEGRLAWNGLIWSFVSVKAETMRYILAVNFFHFFKTFCWVKEMNYLNKNPSTSAQKKDRFREFIAAIFRNVIKTPDIWYLCATSSSWRKSLK